MSHEKLIADLRHMLTLATWHKHQATLDAAIAALSVAQGQGFVPRVECQMDWTPVDMHHKKWTCRNCGRTHTRNSSDGHPHFPCAAPAQPDGVGK